MTEWEDIAARLARDLLLPLGGFHEDGGTLVLVGPDEPSGFWGTFRESAEARDGRPDPMDRWSVRVLSGAATALGAEPVFPFGGPPYHPFFRWALKTGRVHESPVRLLVHDRAGLWVSFRAALRFDAAIALPGSPPGPCLSCTGKPCLTTCPADALNERGYDAAACKGYLNTPAGGTCMTGGCRVRAACPAGLDWGRAEAQSAFHMRAFNPS